MPDPHQPGDPMPDPGRPSRTFVTRLTAALALIALTSLAVMLPVPYVTLRPGPAFDTLGEFEGQPMFTFGSDVTTYPTSGNLDFTTVRVASANAKVSLVEAVEAYLDDDVAVVPRSLVYPEGATAESSREQSAAQLDGSKDSSRVAALRAAGFDVPGTPQVADVSPDGAAAGKLQPGDLIRAVDAQDVTTSEETVEAVGAGEPGDTISVEVNRDGAVRTIEVTTRADEVDPTIPRLGISVGTQYDFPIEIENNVGDTIGGPSAGTMFALAIYDRLTPGSLTGGLKVAGTGEISADGVVGSIGGIQQKIAGAAAEDATVFLVPAPNCAEALEGDTKGLTLVETSTLDDAISSLEKLADDPDARVPTCS
ncbi:YlbL family protein [Aeromicrobium sp. CF3.5]|uniref:YlbL family protein n=1 Tax=Aeromicrobium sp. CF3.5 TaxID=3373078 RepID=UPI003EE5530E